MDGTQHRHGGKHRRQMDATKVAIEFRLNGKKFCNTLKNIHFIYNTQ